MIKLDICCGMLGAGKTTLIQQLLKTAYADGKTAIVENEVGKVNLDAEAFDSSSLAVREVTSGCICCTVKGAFRDAIQYLAETEHPDYIVIEPSGVADITSLVEMCQNLTGIELNRVIMVVNGKRITTLLKAAGPFLADQIRHTQMIYLNFADSLTESKIQEAKAALLEVNPRLEIYQVPLAEITAETFPSAVHPRIVTMKSRISSVRKSGTRLPFSEGKEIRKNTDAPEAVTWYYTFPNTFSEKQIEQLLDILQNENCESIWRVKGYLRMEDDSIRKVDLVYGDVYEASMETFAEDKTNILIVIGEKIPEEWMTGQFQTLAEQ